MPVCFVESFVKRVDSIFSTKTFLTQKTLSFDSKAMCKQLKAMLKMNGSILLPIPTVNFVSSPDSQSFLFAKDSSTCCEFCFSSLTC